MALEINILKQPFEVNFSGNPIFYSFAFSPYGFVERSLDLKMKIGIEKEASPYTDIWTEIKSDIFFPNIDGGVSLDIRSIADAYLKYYIPRYTMVTALAVQGQSARFRITALIQQDGHQIGDVITADPITVVKGGLAYEQFHQSQFFAQYITTLKKPLHYFSGSNSIGLSEPKFLSWIYPFDDNAEQFIKFTMFNAGSANTTETQLITVSVPKWGLCLAKFSVPPGDIAVGSPWEALNTYDLIAFQVSVVLGDGTEIVAPIRFEIDYRAETKARTLLYFNSLGGVDTLRLLGDIENQAEYTSSDAKVIPPPSGIRNATLVPQLVTTENNETEKFSGNTDFIKEERLNNLRDIFLSKNLYEIKDRKFIPIYILKKSIKFYTNRDNLFSLLIEWQHAFANTHYSVHNALDDDFSCPALDTFKVIQLAKNKLQILWAMPFPYDLLEVQIDNGVSIDTIYLAGNSGTQTVAFENPAVSPATAPIVIKGRVICNADIDPMDMGAQTTVNIDAFANLLPVANPDQFYLAAGFNTPQLLPGSVMDNDYDLDDDPLEVVVVAAGATTAGGTYDIDAAGIVTYTPPTSLYNGQDSFTYRLREVADHTSFADAEVKINVGNVGLSNKTYVKLVQRNAYTYQVGTIGHHVYTKADIVMCFFSDPVCTIPKNITGVGLTITVRKTHKITNNGAVTTNTSTDQVFAGAGLEMPVYTGQILHTWTVIIAGNHIVDSTTFVVQPGAGYVPV